MYSACKHCLLHVSNSTTVQTELTLVRMVIDVHEPLMVPIYGSCHSWPGLLDAEVPLHVTLCNYLILMTEKQ